MTRREWLRKGILYGAVGGTLSTCGALLLDVWLAAGRFTTIRWTEVTSIETLKLGRVVPFPENRVAVVRRNERIAALSLECSHLGCLLNTTGQGFFCPCHGSEFGPLGEVYSGPAQKSLMWHAVRNIRGRVWIRTGGKLHQPQWVRLAGDQDIEESQEL